MSLKHLLFVGAYVVASAHAAVNFYGSERPDGDYVTCEVPDVSDEDVSAALGILYFPGEVVLDSNDLQFEEPLFCGDLASVAVDFACYDLGGESDCIPAQPDGNADADSDGTETNADDKISERSLAHLEKRAGAACDPCTLECKNQYRSTTAFCASDYEKETVPVQGTTGDIWCVKACTDEEAKVCQNQECPKGKEQCEKFGYSNDCAKALAKCTGLPVKMPEAVCTTKYMARLFDNFCKNKDPACVAYADGTCTLNAVQANAFVEELSKAFKQTIG